jgi:hypothetical protein
LIPSSPSPTLLKLLRTKGALGRHVRNWEICEQIKKDKKLPGLVAAIQERAELNGWPREPDFMSIPDRILGFVGELDRLFVQRANLFTTIVWSGVENALRLKWKGCLSDREAIIFRLMKSKDDQMDLLRLGRPG